MACVQKVEARSMRSFPHEPAKVHMSAVGDCEPAKVHVDAPPGLACPPPPGLECPQEPLEADVEKERLRAENSALREYVEKERLKAENAALRECLLKQQSNMGCWQGDWCQSEDWCQAEYFSGQQWASSCESMEVHVGAEVVFQGLQRAPELNGVHGMVQMWDKGSERWVVLLASGEEKFLKAGNLVVAYPAWSSCYGWQSGAATKKPACEMKKTGLLRNSSNNSFASDSTASGATASFTSARDEEAKTTVMMRNLPNDYTREMLLKLLDDEGFRGSYDLLYLPIDYNSEVGFGYAFINFVAHAEAERFRAHFTDFARWDIVSQKVCEVTWSTVLQGVQEHVDRYRNSPVMHEDVRDEFKPVLFKNGVRVPFPRPTKPIRAPRVRRRV